MNINILRFLAFFILIPVGTEAPALEHQPKASTISPLFLVQGHLGFGFSYNSVFQNGELFFHPLLTLSQNSSERLNVEAKFEAHSLRNDHDVYLKTMNFEYNFSQRASINNKGWNVLFGKAIKGFELFCVDSCSSNLDLQTSLIDQLNLFHFFGFENQISLRNFSRTAYHQNQVPIHFTMGFPESKHNNISAGIGSKWNHYAIYANLLYQMQRYGDKNIPIRAISFKQDWSFATQSAHLLVLVGEDPEEKKLSESLTESSSANDSQFFGFELSYSHSSVYQSGGYKFGANSILSQISYDNKISVKSARDLQIGLQMQTDPTWKSQLQIKRKWLELKNKFEPVQDEILMRLDFFVHNR